MLYYIVDKQGNKRAPTLDGLNNIIKDWDHDELFIRYNPYLLEEMLRTQNRLALPRKN